jgi:hypothetical protein
LGGNIEKMNRLCSTHDRNAYKYLAGKPGGKRPFGKPWHCWEDNIKKTWCQHMDWIHSTGQIPVVGSSGNRMKHTRQGISQVVSDYQVLRKDFPPWRELGS